MLRKFCSLPAVAQLVRLEAEPESSSLQLQRLLLEARKHGVGGPSCAHGDTEDTLLARVRGVASSREGRDALASSFTFLRICYRSIGLSTVISKSFWKRFMFSVCTGLCVNKFFKFPISQ